MLKRWQPAVIISLVVLLLGGCSPLAPQGILHNTNDVVYHTVRKGDTLYSMAWSLGYDYRQLAAWNNIKPPYLIYIGQKLRITPPTRPVIESRSSTAAIAAHPHSTPEVKNPPKVKTSSHSGKTVEIVTAHRHNSHMGWRWPVPDGKVVQSFDPKAGKKGVDIGGKPGEPVYAAAAGEVVYSGNGLIGYGNLVIIKHDDAFLSAYAYNSVLLVKEGESVRAGTKIAQMGRAANGESILHFEIRHDGNPIDPLRFLPRRGR